MRSNAMIPLVLCVLAAVPGCQKPAPAPVKPVMTFEAWEQELAQTVKPGISTTAFHNLLGDRWRDKQMFHLGKYGALCLIYVLEGQTILRLTCNVNAEVVSYGLAHAPPDKKTILSTEFRLLSGTEVQRVLRSDTDPAMNPSQWYHVVRRVAAEHASEPDIEGLAAGVYLDKQMIPLTADRENGPYRVVYLLRGGVVLDARYESDGKLAEYLIGPARDEKATTLGSYEDWREYMRPDAKRPVVSYPPLDEQP